MAQNEAAKLENILGRLLTPDNTVIQQATAELKEILKSPAVIGQLASLLTVSQFPQVRQYAAILLRRKISKLWNKLDSDSRFRMKQLCLQALTQESIKIVQHSIAEIISVIAKYDLPEGNWNELMILLSEYTKSPDGKLVEIGMHVLKSISSNGGETLKPYLSSLFPLFGACLSNTDNVIISSYALEVMTNIMDYLGPNDIAIIKPFIPKAIDVIKKLLTTDEIRAQEAMEFFDQIAESNINLLNSNLLEVIQFCLQIAQNDQFEDSTRCKALSFISWVTTLKKKSMLRLNLVPTVLEVIFPILSSSASSDDTDMDDDESENSVVTNAGQLIDVFALHLPPETFFSFLFPYIDRYFNSQEPLKVKAALVSIAVVAEGCSEYIRFKLLDRMVMCIGKGIESHHEIVQNAALYALGQFAMYLQPDVNKYAPNILPLLFNHLGNLVKKATANKTFAISRAYYALEQFCEHLDADINPYLQSLLEMLLATLNNTQISFIKELAISALGATVNAAKDAIRPYFQGIVDILKPYIILHVADSGECFDLRLQAIDTLGCLIRCTNEEILGSFAEECVQLGLNLINEVDDPDLRRCIYSLIAAISNPTPNVIRKYINTIAMRMISSIQSRDGLLIPTGIGDGPLSGLIDFEDNGSDDDDDDKYCEVSNAFLAEKEDACNSISEIAKNIGNSFLPYLDESLIEVNKLITSEWENIRKAAVSCLATLCRLLYACHLQFKSGSAPTVFKALENLLNTVMQIIGEDPDRIVVIAALAAAEEIMRDLREDFVNQCPELFPGFIRIVARVLNNGVACQDNSDNGDAEEIDEGIAEYDGLVVEHAGNLLPIIINLVGGENFAPSFGEILSLLVKRNRPSSSVSERSFVIGTLAEMSASMRSAIKPFVKDLYPLFLSSTDDEDDDVCNNAIYGLGLLAQHGDQVMYGNYMDILQALFRAAPKRGNRCRQLLDNICACVSRLIIANDTLVPIDNVFPQVVSNLPLVVDKEENKVVFTSILKLLNAGHAQVFSHMDRLIVIFATVLSDSEVDEDTVTIIHHIVANVRQRFPAEFDKVVATMNASQKAAMLAVFEGKSS
ncbi:Importin-4 [Trichoplax sp. H2]|nr:Importin-4 [Trichoplax sp. H2]|eukprot:RDD47604.1 Importin-4 [Trichoplax sp. H2]